jgi:hypothetical protein
MAFQLSRRRFLTGASAAGSSLALSGCDAFDSLTRNGSAVRSVLEQANSLTYRVQRMLLSSDALLRVDRLRQIAEALRTEYGLLPFDGPLHSAPCLGPALSYGSASPIDAACTLEESVGVGRRGQPRVQLHLEATIRIARILEYDGGGATRHLAESRQNRFSLVAQRGLVGEASFVLREVSEELRQPTNLAAFALEKAATPRIERRPSKATLQKERGCGGPGGEGYEDTLVDAKRAGQQGERRRDHQIDVPPFVRRRRTKQRRTR